MVHEDREDWSPFDLRPEEGGVSPTIYQESGVNDKFAMGVCIGCSGGEDDFTEPLGVPGKDIRLEKHWASMFKL
jgi:hypothetical protein